MGKAFFFPKALFFTFWKQNNLPTVNKLCKDTWQDYWISHVVHILLISCKLQEPGRKGYY